MQFASKVSACRRELNSHNLAEPRRESHADRHAGYRASPVLEQFEREVVPYSYRSRIQTYSTRKENNLAPQHQNYPPDELTENQSFLRSWADRFGAVVPSLIPFVCRRSGFCSSTNMGPLSNCSSAGDAR